MSGYIKLYRGITDNPVWNKDPYSAGQAWIDLLLAANFKEKTIFIRNTAIKVERGQLAWSTVTMAARWKWSRNKVIRFLKTLKSEHMIEQEAGHLTTLTTICNYEKYQGYDTAGDTTDDTADGTADGTAGDTADGTQHKKVNKVKNVNKVKKSAPETTLPEDFTVTDSMKAWFSKQEFSINLEQATDRWQDAMLAKGRTNKDWTAAWRNGMKLANSWNEQRRETIQAVPASSEHNRPYREAMPRPDRPPQRPTGTGGDS
jgi:hypothetical protein